VKRRYKVIPEEMQKAVAKANSTLSVETRLLTWCAVHGSLQFALRHPEFPPTTRVLIESFVQQLGVSLVESGFFTAETLQEAVALEQQFHAPRIPQV
jgi:hypothetical protein